MLNFISQTITKVSTLIGKLQLKQLLSVVLVGFLLITTNTAKPEGNNPIANILDKIGQRTDSQNDSRPKTTGEWKQQARETKDNPGERLKRIGEQSVEAVKDLGSVYPDTAKRSAASLRNGNNN